MLPAHPSVLQVQAWFAGVAVLACLALWLLPDLRLAIAIAGCAIEAFCVIHNYRKGIKP